MKNISIIILAVLTGILIGEVASESVVADVILVVRNVAGQVIFFLVPLIVLAFVTAAVTSLRDNATRLFLVAFLVAWISSEASAFFSLIVSYVTVPLLHPGAVTEATSLPKPLFTFEIPPVMNVLSALLLAVFIGLGTVWTKAETLRRLTLEFREVVLILVRRVLTPVLPVYIVANFAVITWQGNLSKLAVLLPVMGILIALHAAWIAVLYIVASAYSRQNGWKVLRHYGPAYLTALGTMSSAATLGTALDCARRSEVLDDDVPGFTVPLFANIHLCGATLTETFLLAVISMLLYGHLPEPATFVVFVFLLGIFAVGAPGAPGGTAFATVGIVAQILGFDEGGVALFLTLFALQDSFGTGCNIVGDGALTLIIQKYKTNKNRN